MGTPRQLATLFAFLASSAAVAPACSIGEGGGHIAGTLNVPNCWTGHFDLQPDFFGGTPYRNSLDIRIQNGSDFQNFADGVSILIDDVTRIRPAPAASFPGKYGQPLTVSIPPGVSPPGVPITPNPDPALVHMALYLQRSCRTQDVALHALDAVTLATDGTCQADEMKGADPQNGCDENATSPGGQGSGKSFIAFTQLFDGLADETNAAQRLTKGCFDVYLADPREIAPGGLGPPPPCRGHIKGTFNFFFQRGKPAQPFP